MSLIAPIFREAEVIINFFRPEQLKYILNFAIRALNEYSNIFLLILVFFLILLILINFFKK
jgi:hypothetical protein